MFLKILVALGLAALLKAPTSLPKLWGRVDEVSRVSTAQGQAFFADRGSCTRVQEWAHKSPLQQSLWQACVHVFEGY